MPAQDPHDLTTLLDRVAALVRDAGDTVMAIYRSDFTVQDKADASPVTLADQQAEAVILAGLRALTPEWPVVAEEAVAAGGLPDLAGARRFWLVDPLDGTREFVARNGEFTVNVALVEDGRPVLGVVLAPALPGAPAGGRLWAGAAGAGAWTEDAGGRRAIACRRVPAEGWTVLASRSHGDAAALDGFLAAHPAGRRLARLDNAGSSLKLCLVAEGRADLYPRLGRTMAWDIAAAHAVLAAAGGSVQRLDDGQALRYGGGGFENPHFVACGLGEG